MEHARFSASETQDKVVGLCLNEETATYQIALFEIEPIAYGINPDTPQWSKANYSAASLST